MIVESSFYCQLRAISVPLLARLICGVTSSAIVLKNLGRFSEFEEGPYLEKFFSYVAALHKGTVPLQKRRFDLRNSQVFVTVDPTGKISVIEETDIIVDPDEVYFPAYSLELGYDHRASRYIFDHFSLNAELVRFGLEELREKFVTGVMKYFLPSTVYVGSTGRIGSHIVVVQRFDDSYIEYVDPVVPDFSSAQKRVSVEDFAKIYRGFGTAVYA